MASSHLDNFVLCHALIYQILHENGERIETNDLGDELIRLVGEAEWIEGETRIAHLVEALKTEDRVRLADIPEKVFAYAMVYARDSRAWSRLQRPLERLARDHWNDHTAHLRREHDRITRDSGKTKSKPRALYNPSYRPLILAGSANRPAAQRRNKQGTGDPYEGLALKARDVGFLGRLRRGIARCVLGGGSFPDDRSSNDTFPKTLVHEDSLQINAIGYPARTTASLPLHCALTLTSPAEKTFAVPELGAKILAFLPAVEILPVRRVSHALKDVISSCPILQLALFLRRDDQVLAGAQVERTKMPAEIRWTLYRAPDGDFLNNLNHLVRPNPFVFVLPPSIDSVWQTLALRAKFGKHLRAEDWQPRHGIAMEMFISQPTVRSISVGITVEMGRSSFRLTWGTKLVVDGGIKVKHLVELVRELVLEEQDNSRRSKLERTLKEGNFLIRFREGYEVLAED
ncbi:uncharacterized protein MYCGRDRAFT_94672 [Zymoseptoria tritici IPO323]|uniref:F-box domain-containing protein n=1 Tax=Zymoseptoria tritici (strain CBS 115943 / IPO323) TaxID=336722 RepID=F9XGQ0_ZYMTI|nr:uncharacterized protein MYCGRDRAFT_94672 [Zymoseptoria tritici IPO323]EGP85799.1 hypothetical protein MYCGRDRAFT_94672 [Zymoseptoria tritici IPO323]